MKNLSQFADKAVSRSEANDTKGGSYNIFCEIYIGYTQKKGLAIDPSILGVAIEWDAALNKWVASR